MTKGICLIACGHPAYGQWALNLCMSIRATDPEASITLFHYGQGASHIVPFSYLFENVIEIPSECVTKDGVESLVRAKVCLYDLSPYDETIFIDADVVCFPNKKVADLFEQLKDVEFTIGNRGEINPESENKFAWVSSKKLSERFPGQKVFNLSSEFIYFKKGKVAKKIFSEAKKAFDDPKMEFRRFAGAVPDELAFQIAMMKIQAEPHASPFLPFYWEAHEKKQYQLHELYRTGFFGYSMGGNTQHQIPMANYNNLAQYYARQFGLRHHYPMRDKREFLAQRKMI